MFKNFIMITAAIVSVGFLVTDHANAGASVSAPSKYGHASQVARIYPVRTHRKTNTAKIETTSFSSSSANKSPNR